MLCLARTKTTLAEINIIGSAETDPFLILKRPRSLLCLPLISQKTLQAVLYLHSYSVDAFKADEREVLKVLSVQAAISLEKLTVYQELDRTNTALLAELHEKMAELSVAKELSENAKLEAEKAKDEAEQAKLDALKSKDEAVRANDLKSSFLATMSHEIRTPFNAVLPLSENSRLLGFGHDSSAFRFWVIGGPSRLYTPSCWFRMLTVDVGMRFPFPSFWKIAKYAETIKTASTDLLRIINDILDFSKVVPLFPSANPRLKTTNWKLKLPNFLFVEQSKAQWSWFVQLKVPLTFKVSNRCLIKRLGISTKCLGLTVDVGYLSDIKDFDNVSTVRSFSKSLGPRRCYSGSPSRSQSALKCYEIHS
jgi:GAF domain